MKNWRGGVKFQKKLRIPSSKFSHLWADHLAGPSSFSYAQLISTPCLQYIGFIRLGFLKVRVLLKNPFYQISQCKSLNNKLSGWKLISVFPMQTTEAWRCVASSLSPTPRRLDRAGGRGRVPD